MSLKLKREAATTNFMRESYRPLLPYINRLSWVRPASKKD